MCTKFGIIFRFKFKIINERLVDLVRDIFVVWTKRIFRSNQRLLSHMDVVSIEWLDFLDFELTSSVKFRLIDNEMHLSLNSSIVLFSSRWNLFVNTFGFVRLFHSNRSLQAIYCSQLNFIWAITIQNYTNSMNNCAIIYDVIIA